MLDGRRPLWMVASAVAALLMVWGPQRVYGQCQEALFRSPDPLEREQLGTAVAINGDFVIVGAPLPPFSDLGPGSAYVYRFDGEAWREEDKLTASDGEDQDQFGDTVSITKVALVGARGDDDDGSAPFCLGDVDRNGETGFNDLLFVLNDWASASELERTAT